MSKPFLQYMRDGSDVLLAPPTNWTHVTEDHLGNPQWGHWNVWHGQHAALQYLGDPRVMPFSYLLERWAFSHADHFLIKINGSNIEDLVEQLQVASEKNLFLELAVPTLLALLSARPAFAPVVQAGGSAQNHEAALKCLDASFAREAKGERGGSGGGGGGGEGGGHKEEKEGSERESGGGGEGEMGGRGVFACHPIKLKDHFGLLSHMVVRDVQLAALFDH
jgi:hypothetical protein